MRDRPFEISPQRLPWRDAEIKARNEEIESDAARRLAGMTIIPDERRGFGTVYAKGRMWGIGDTLTWWTWRCGTPEHHPEWLAADRFRDDPMGAVPADTLGTRAAAADAFAAAANAYFDEDDVRFFARPIEVVVAGPTTPAGFTRGTDADTLSIDLLAGFSNSRVIDRLVWEEHRGDLDRVVGLGWDCTWLRIFVWHRAERLTAARAMFDPTLPPIKVPGISSLRRRMVGAEEALRAGSAVSGAP